MASSDTVDPVSPVTFPPVPGPGQRLITTDLGIPVLLTEQGDLLESIQIMVPFQSVVYRDVDALCELFAGLTGIPSLHDLQWEVVSARCTAHSICLAVVGDASEQGVVGEGD